MQTSKGQSIEDASMKMIEDEIGDHQYSDKEWPIVRRIIHSTADFDFAKDNAVIFHQNAIRSGTNALKSGCSIVVDVNGVDVSNSYFFTNIETVVDNLVNTANGKCQTSGWYMEKVVLILLKLYLKIQELRIMD